MSRAVKTNKISAAALSPLLGSADKDAPVFPIKSEIEIEALEVKLQESAPFRKSIVSLALI